MDQAAPRHILVIEDEPDLADLVRINLELSGYEIAVAHDGAAGLAAARERIPDLVLLDVMMPVLDGWQVLRELREDERLQDVPVIMLTALSAERDVIRGHLDGVLQYVTKPFRMDGLLEAVERGIAEPDAEELAARRARVRHLLQRLAELDSGRSGEGTTVRLSRLEQPPRRAAAAPAVTDEERARLEQLTDKQRHVADELAQGRSARDLARELGVSRSNVYATRKRVAKKLRVAPDDVGDEVRRLTGGG